MEEPVNEEIVEVPTTETFDLAPIEARMEEHTLEIREIRNEIGNYFAGAPSVTPPMTLHRAFATILRMVADDPGQNRALADVIGTSPGNASGLIRDAWNTELIGYVNALRPLFSAAGTAQFPSAGYGIAYPKVTTHSQVAKRTAEKAEAATRELIVSSVTFPMEWFAGALDISLELISQSDPSVLEVVASDLMDQYAVVTEAEFATDVIAAATAGGAVLPTSTWAAFSCGSDRRISRDPDGDRSSR